MKDIETSLPETSDRCPRCGSTELVGLPSRTDPKTFIVFCTNCKFQERRELK